jgi:hypothetical protein
VTVISATHDHKMLSVSDRIFWISDGRVAKISRRDELKIEEGTVEGPLWARDKRNSEQAGKLSVLELLPHVFRPRCRDDPERRGSRGTTTLRSTCRRSTPGRFA